MVGPTRHSEFLPEHCSPKQWHASQQRQNGAESAVLSILWARRMHACTTCGGILDLAYRCLHIAALITLDKGLYCFCDSCQYNMAEFEPIA